MVEQWFAVPPMAVRFCLSLSGLGFLLFRSSFIAELFPSRFESYRNIVSTALLRAYDGLAFVRSFF